MDSYPSQHGHQHAAYPPQLSKLEVLGYITDCGIGLAEIHYNHACERLTIKRFDGTLDNGLLFGANEPKVGSFSTLIEGPFAYLWGEYNGHIILARTCQQEPSTRDLYEFWNGTDYVKDYTSAGPMSAFDDIPKGAIIRSNLFGKHKKYVFVGVSKWCDSLIRVGAAEGSEGPWEIWPVAMTQGINKTDGFRYCIYPHMFASHTRNAELMVTWSEQWPGGVFAGRVKFLTEELVCEEECELID
ncbi:hypothetical protein OEA41_007124 [Lepraria neglecta]|uniref:DUF4185 domain-containing protein n=1 Tax=Lepraria neglecta TaxID=209136 RepID=A0AAD9ZBL0_9LECA|nr:hypothetical protein OEA41_007124 [Lepraria neglecta]